MTSDKDDTTRRHALQLAAGVAAVAALGNEAAAAVPNVAGVWKLVGGSMTDPSGKSVGVPYGPRGMGLVSLTSDGRMMAVLIDGRAKLPDGAKREYSSYCGNYTSTAARSSPRSTPAPIRAARLAAGAQGALRGRAHDPGAAERDDGGVKIHRELIWERISPISL
jgi:hypothetical protein